MLNRCEISLIDPSSGISNLVNHILMQAPNDSYSIDGPQDDHSSSLFCQKSFFISIITFEGEQCNSSKSLILTPYNAMHKECKRSWNAKLSVRGGYIQLQSKQNNSININKQFALVCFASLFFIAENAFDLILKIWSLDRLSIKHLEMHPTHMPYMLRFYAHSSSFHSLMCFEFG
jgi:hypothetical protein